MKLHLGCGQYYLEGYVNVDYPPSDHAVQTSLRADIQQDLSTLDYPRESVEEVRLHHVLEHFSRPVTLALLCRWRDWLVPGGNLRVETPDVMASAWLLVNPFMRYGEKQEVIRHLFGSHEAHWAVHWDGWYPERFKRTLRALGFEDISVETAKWARLRNVEVRARKGLESRGVDGYRPAVRALLLDSLIKSQTRRSKSPQIADSELDMLNVWMDMWERAYLAPVMPG